MKGHMQKILDNIEWEIKDGLYKAHKTQIKKEKGMTLVTNKMSARLKKARQIGKKLVKAGELNPCFACHGKGLRTINSNKRQIICPACSGVGVEMK